MMDRNQVNCVLFLIVWVTTGGCQEEHTENPLQSNIHFNHLEEEAQRLKNIEEELFRRTTTLLAINDRLIGLSEDFKKSDPFIASLFNVPVSGVHSSTLDEWMAHPAPSLQGSNPDARTRTKRQKTNHNSGSGILTFSDKLYEALKLAMVTPTRGPDINILTTQNTTPQPTLSSTQTFRPSPTPTTRNTTPKPTPSTQTPLPSSTKRTLIPAGDTNGQVKPGPAVIENVANTKPPSAPPAVQLFVKDMIDNIQGAAKCALAQLNETNPSESTGRLIEVKATLNDHLAGRMRPWLQIEFELRNCHKHFTALWIELYEPRNEGDSRFMQVSKECLTKTGDIFSVTLPSTKKDCISPLMDLVECKIYNVKLIPIYQGFQGQSPSVVEISVPPQITGSSSNLISLKRVSGNIQAEWSVQSKDCVRLMTSVDMRFSAGQANRLNPIRTITMSPDCFLQHELNNLFLAGIYETKSTSHCYTSTGFPLEMCRSYTLEVQANYLSILQGPSSFVDFFTTRRDENKCCNLLTSSSGSFESLTSYGDYYNHAAGELDCTWLISVEPDKFIWLTFTQSDIERRNPQQVKVYDGSEIDENKLIVSFDGIQPSQPMRSNSNKMLVQIIHPNRDPSDSEIPREHFTGHYTAVPNVGLLPYVPGCGGYSRITDEGKIIGTKTILKPDQPSTHSSLNECLWYIEQNHSPQTTILNSKMGISSFPVTIYEGWSASDKKIIYSQPGNASKAAIYLPKNKMLIKFPSWNTADQDKAYSWDIEVARSRINDKKSCLYNLTSLAGKTRTLRSPNYPSTYPNLIDCRWTIQTKPASKIILTIVYLDTVPDYDYVTIYDGPSDNDPILLEISGSIDEMEDHEINSSTNVMTVRFTTSSNNFPNEPRSGTGFLAFHSSHKITP